MSYSFFMRRNYSVYKISACYDKFWGNYWGFLNFKYFACWKIDLIFFSQLIKFSCVQNFSMLWQFCRKLLRIFKFAQMACCSVLPAWFGKLENWSHILFSIDKTILCTKFQHAMTIFEEIIEDFQFWPKCLLLSTTNYKITNYKNYKNANQGKIHGFYMKCIFYFYWNA